MAKKRLGSLERCAARKVFSKDWLFYRLKAVFTFFRTGAPLIFT